MSTCKYLLSSSALCTFAFVSAATVLLPLQKPEPAKGGAQKPSQAEPGKPVEAASPKLTPEHGILKKMVGNWDAVVTTSMPGKPSTTSSGKAEYKAVGETWVESTFIGEMDGRPYIGHGVDGFDPQKGKFVSTWVDSWSTELHVFEGTQDSATNTTTRTGECHDPATGKAIKQRSVTEMKGNDEMLFRFYMEGPDGKEAESMKIDYKRRK